TITSARRHSAPRCPWRAAPAALRVFAARRSPAGLSPAQPATEPLPVAAGLLRARAGQRVVGHASRPARVEHLPLAGVAIRRSTTYTTLLAEADCSDHHGHDVRIRQGFSACTAPKTLAGWRAPAPRALLARPPAQHAGRRPRLSSWGCHLPHALQTLISGLQLASQSVDTEGCAPGTG